MNNLYNLIEDTAKKFGYKNITEFCKQTGIPRATMSELKAGRTKKLSAKTAQIIYTTLQIPLDTLLGLNSVDDLLSPKNGQKKEALSQNGKELSPEEEALLNLFRQIPAEKQESILASIEMALRMQGLL